MGVEKPPSFPRAALINWHFDRLSVPDFITSRQLGSRDIYEANWEPCSFHRLLLREGGAKFSLIVWARRTVGSLAVAPSVDSPKANTYNILYFGCGESRN